MRPTLVLALSLGLALPRPVLAQDYSITEEQLRDFVGISCSVNIEGPIYVYDGPGGQMMFSEPQDAYLTILDTALIDGQPWAKVSYDNGPAPGDAIGWVLFDDLACI